MHLPPKTTAYTPHTGTCHITEAEVLTVIIPEKQRKYVAFGKATRLYPTDESCGLYAHYCNLEPEELYQEKEIKTDDLLDFLSRSMAEGIYHLSEDDFHVQNRALGVDFLLCHESDIHLETENREVAAYTKARWAVK